MSKQPNAAERRHHAQIREMPCLLCGAAPVSVHHVVSDGYKRVSKDHRYVAPLCPECHQNGPDAIHRNSPEHFNELLGFNLLDWASDQWEASQEP